MEKVIYLNESTIDLLNTAMISIQVAINSSPLSYEEKKQDLGINDLEDSQHILSKSLFKDNNIGSRVDVFSYIGALQTLKNT